jgi:large conductance mechanosensitive channel
VVKEFRDFLFRGNVIDLAVAVVLGTAFGVVVSSFVGDILTPLLGLLGIPDFSTWVIAVGDAEMRIGVFLNAVIYFVMVGLAIFFAIVKPMKMMEARMAKDEAEEPTGPTEIELLTQIRDALHKSS